MSLNFYERLQKVLFEKKMRAADLSRRAGLDQGTISRWKRLKTAPQLDSIEKIVAATGASKEYLLDGTGSMFSPKKDASSATNNSITQTDNSSAQAVHHGDIINKTDKPTKQISRGFSLYLPGDATLEMEKERCLQEMNSLFQMIIKWQEDENGLDSLTSMKFIREFHNRFPELGEWLEEKKKK